MAIHAPRANKHPVKSFKVATVQKNKTGPYGKAAMLTPEQFDKAIDFARQHMPYGARDSLMILLSRFCGLRAKEIATLHVRDFTDAEGKVIPELRVSKRGAKYGKERTIDLREEVVDEIKAYLKLVGIEDGPIFWTERGTPMTSNAVQKQLRTAYEGCGFKGARSHSGRRYAITTLAQRVNTIGASLDDVKIFAGHSNLETTAHYIERSPHAKKMIGLL